MRTRGRDIPGNLHLLDDGRPSTAQLMDLNMLVMLPGQERTRGE
jgi:hypothetical protein